MTDQRGYGEVLPATSRERRMPASGRPSVSGNAPQQSPYPFKRKRNVWRTVLGIALIVLVLSLGALGAIVFSYWQGQETYHEIAAEASPNVADVLAQSEDGKADLAALTIDWDALREINPEVIGWIYVPGTVVNYPVVHTTDNVKYLSTDFRGDHGWLAQFGCIFLSAENTADFSDANNVVYGHHMNDGSMFGFIDNLFDGALFNRTRDVYLLTPAGNYRLQTFALITCQATDPIAQVSFASGEEFQTYLQDKVDRTAVTVDPQVDLSSISRIFSLVTCDNAINDNNGREVLFATVVETTAPDNPRTVNDTAAAQQAAEELAGS